MNSTWMTWTRLASFLIAALPLASACSRSESSKTDEARQTVRTAVRDRRAEADFKAASGLDLAGTAKLEETASGVLIQVTLKHAPPGRKGIHIHEKGDCNDIAGQSMGSHFNPSHVQHGLPDGGVHHPGDLGNIEIDADGNGQLQITTEGGSLAADEPTSFLHRAIVIHEADDKGVQPTGGAGNPIACAVIGAG